MAPRSFNRRSFLLGTAALGGVLAALAPARRAHAFAFEKVSPQSGLGVAFANRCGSDGEHARIRAMLEQELAKENGSSGSLLTRQALCPICGCPIIATRQVP
jgi:hypothetical protein